MPSVSVGILLHYCIMPESNSNIYVVYNEMKYERRFNSCFELVISFAWNISESSVCVLLITKVELYYLLNFLSDSDILSTFSKKTKKSRNHERGYQEILGRL